VSTLFLSKKMLFKKIDSASDDTIANSLDLFNIPGTNVTASKTQYREYLTLNPVTDAPYHFKIYAGSSFLDLSKTYLLTEMHLERRNMNNVWTPTSLSEKGNVIQGIGSTFIENMKITLNGSEISNSNRLYAYRAFLDMTLSYGGDACDTHLQLCGFYNQNSVNDEEDLGYLQRKALFNNGQRAQFISRLHADIFQQQKLLLNQMEMEIQIMPNLNSQFCIETPDSDKTEYRLVIDSCRLYVKLVDIFDSLSLSFASQLAQKPAKYAIRRTEMKSMVIGAGRREFTASLFNNQLPRRIVLGIVDHADFTGSTRRTPFNFINAGVQSIGLAANGLQYPSINYYLDFERDLYARAYHHMMDDLGYSFSNSSNTITMEKFKNGWAFFVFNMTSTGEDEPGFDLLKNGATTLIIKFDKDVPAGGYELIVYAEYDSLLMVDSNRLIASDLTA